MMYVGDHVDDVCMDQIDEICMDQIDEICSDHVDDVVGGLVIAESVI